jgi:RHS repeat-associated protein
VSRLASKNLENGVATAYSYDAAHRLVGLSHQRGSTLLAGFTYTLDSVGNRLSKTQSGLLARTETYAYDAVDQLLSAQYAGVGLARTVSYQYDAVGNRQWRNDVGTTTNYAVNPDNAYTQVGGAPTTLDANGNHAGHAGATYTYDAQNRLTSATVNATTTTFTYDARNRVIQRTVSSGNSASTTHLTYSQWHLIEERNETGDLAQVYVHGAAMDELLVKFTPESAVYYHHDGLGSTIALTDETGQLIESYAYDAFGAASIYDASGSALSASLRENRFLFTGREWLAEANLYDYRNRVYSPDLGRFLQTDPIRFSAGDVNLYRYVLNNPVNAWDPLGLDGIYIHYDNYPINTGMGFDAPLGHAGVVSVCPDTGSTRYYEYGRYDPEKKGMVRRQRVPDLKIGSDGKPTQESLNNLYDFLSKNYGKNSPVSPNYYPDADHNKINEFMENLKNDPNRKDYNLLNNNCKTVARDAISAVRN